MSYPIHRYPLTVLEIHLDLLGHVNNAMYLTLFEEARWDLITRNGYGVDKIKETGLSPVVLEFKIKFLRELTLRKKVVIETQLLSMTKKICHIHQTIKSENGEITYTKVDLTCGLFDLAQRKLITATPEWIRGIGASNSLSHTWPQD